ncbi:MAG: protein kinase domain-containing protein [Myxococcaceae bacterium]
MSAREPPDTYVPPGAKRSDADELLSKTASPAVRRPSSEFELWGELTRETPGRYRILEEVARGGQSVVYVAFDAHLGRNVAFKQPLRPASATELAVTSAEARFLREARVTATLEHPNIVPVYEIGRRDDGSLYCTQKLILPPTGETSPRTLRRALAEAKSLPERLRLLRHVLDVAQAVAYAHAHGVIHRDIKPDNVIIGAFGDTVLVDWGLAKIRGLQDPLATDAPAQPQHETMAGLALGTPSYMSPEQARGEATSADERSDVWGLGAMLYEVLTGAAPFVGRTAHEIVQKVISEPLTPVRTLCEDAPPELAAVAELALEKDPAKRYGSAKLLADELDAYITGARVGAYRYSLLELARLLVARHRGVAITSALGLVLLAAAAAIAWSNYLRSERYLGEARQNLARTYIDKAHEAERGFQWDQAAVYYAAARVENDLPEARIGAQLASDRSHEALRFFRGNGNGVNAVAYSPDGKLLALGSADKSVHLWDVQRGEQVRVIGGHGDSVMGVAFSPDSKRLATVADDHKARVFDVAAGALLAEPVTAEDRLNAVAWSSDGKTIAIGSEDRNVYLVDAEKLTLRKKFLAHAQAVYAVAISPDSKLLVTASRDQTARVWTLENGEAFAPAPVLSEHSTPLLAAGFSRDGKLLATAGRDGNIRVWQVPEFTLVRAMPGHTAKVTALAFSPDSRLLATGSADRTVRVWDVAHGQPLLSESYGFESDVLALAFSPDGRQLAWAGVDERAWVRDLRREAAPGDDSQTMLAMQVSPQGRTVAVGEGKSLVVRDVDSFEEKFRIDALPYLVLELAWSPDGKKLAANCSHSDVCVYDVDSHKELFRAFTDPVVVQGIAWSPDGRTLTTSGREGLVRFFDSESGAPEGTLQAHQDSVFSIAYSPDGKLFATASYDKTAKLWDTAAKKELASLKGHVHGLRRVEFSPDGQTLATASWDKTVRLWDVASFSAAGVLQGHEDHVFALDFSPDGQLIASGARDGTVRIWNRHTGEQMATYLADEEWVQAVRFTRDGAALIYGGRRLHRVNLPKLSAPTRWRDSVLGATGFDLVGTAPVRRGPPGPLQGR